MSEKKKAKQEPADKPMSMSSQTHATPALLRSAYDGLDKATKARVDEIMREYRVSCQSLGVQMEDYKLVLRESIDIARLEKTHPEMREQKAEQYEAPWRYKVYQSPVAGVD